MLKQLRLLTLQSVQHKASCQSLSTTIIESDQTPILQFFEWSFMRAEMKPGETNVLVNIAIGYVNSYVHKRSVVDLIRLLLLVRLVDYAGRAKIVISRIRFTQLVD